MLRRSKRAADPGVPPGYSRLEPVTTGGPVVAWRAVQDATGLPVMVFVAGTPEDTARLHRVLAAVPPHPGLAPVSETGRTTAGHPYVAVAAPGPSMHDRVTAFGPLPADEARGIVLRIAAGLGAAHRAGVVHGDVRPEYVLHDGRAPVLTGFWPSPPTRRGVPPAGDALGRAFAHLAPEVIEGAEPTVAADVYALASTLFTMLAGQPAHYAAAGGGLAVLLQRKLTNTLPDLRRPDVTADLISVLHRGMAADPAIRFASVAEFADALGREGAREMAVAGAATVTGSGTAAAGTARPAAESADEAKPSTFDAFFGTAGDTAPAPAVIDGTTVNPIPAPPGAAEAAGTAPASAEPPATAAPPGATAPIGTIAPLRAAPAGGTAPLGTTPPPGETAPAGTTAPPGATASPGTAVPPATAGLDLERRDERPSAQRVLPIAAVALTVMAVAGAIGVVGHGRAHTSTPERTAPHGSASVVPPVSRPTATQEARPPTKVELTRYQPTGLKAVPAPRQVVLTWSLPADAERDGAGIVVRRDPADGGDGITALSRTGGRLPHTSVAVPLNPGQQYCFLVGVLLQRAGGAPMLAQAGPVCATPR
ncbi:protein kinase domain-containing protein [Actinoallomurus rhizosphaericola]|uniref:protein kinase domain-containing protein n=1 Tax=Actinoallomurus rhizosphaericola TaxID=2952536 RepID=UPI002093C219|nr:hypothetical protein [Actinoallomurus rhizosphaericola]MCO5995351.1 hypothetical protein [Actinoallomurus rhizosphaericola]